MTVAPMSEVVWELLRRGVRPSLLTRHHSTLEPLLGVPAKNLHRKGGRRTSSNPRKIAERCLSQEEDVALAKQGRVFEWRLWHPGQCDPMFGGTCDSPNRPLRPSPEFRRKEVQ
jgi:hypothetical protein